MGDELERRLQAAAALAGESVSEFVRRATTTRVDLVLREDTIIEFADVIGAVHGAAVHGGRGQARSTGKSFGEIISEKARSGRAARDGRGIADNPANAGGDLSAAEAGARTS